MDLISSLSSQVMNKALDGLSMRHKAIASNLANVDTPHYRRRDVSFENSLSQALSQRQHNNMAQPASNSEALPMRTTRREHIPLGHQAESLDDVQPEYQESEDIAYRNDGNAVDVETEMAQLAKNTQRYLALSNLESRSFKSLRSVITGGGG